MLSPYSVIWIGRARWTRQALTWTRWTSWSDWMSWSSSLVNTVIGIGFPFGIGKSVVWMTGKSRQLVVWNLLPIVDGEMN
jgi:hypothetical protein